jgi:hypothetical protein
MRSFQVRRLLWIALFLEVSFGLVCLLLNRSLSSFLAIIFLLGFLGAVGFITRSTGLWSSDWLNGKPWEPPAGRPVDLEMPAGAYNSTPRSARATGWNMNNIGNVSFNLGMNPERTEQVSLTVPLDEKVAGFILNLSSGGVKLQGQEGLREVRILATKRVWARDEMEARLDFGRLQLRHWIEGGVLRVEAGDPDQGLVIGRGPRMDLVITLPPALAAELNSTYGEILTKDYSGDLTAKTTLGTIAIESYSSGRNITLNTTSGKLSLQGVAAGIVKARSGAGLIELSGVGAEELDLDSTAASIRARGVNCGRYTAKAVTGSIELYEATVENDLDLKAGAGRVHAENIQAGSLHLEATTGSVFYRGMVPTAPSEVISRVGSVQMVLNPGTGFNLEASSNVGTVETSLPVTNLKYQGRNSFEGQIAGGGAPLRVSSQVGSIKVTFGGG